MVSGLIFVFKKFSKKPDEGEEEEMATSLTEIAAEFSIFKIVEKLWRFLAGGIGQKIGEKASDALAGKIMKEGGLDDELATMEALGAYRPDPDEDSIKLLEEAIGKLQEEHPKFASNLRRVIGSALTFFVEKKEEEKKDENGKVVPGFTGKKKKVESSTKKKARNVLAYLCGGATSVDEILKRAEKVGLYNDAPDGVLDKAFVGAKKMAGKAMSNTVKGAKSVRSVTPVLVEGTATAVTSGLIALVIFIGVMFSFLMFVLFVLWLAFF